MHQRDFGLPSQGGREKIRAMGRDWKGKQENDEGCFNRERRMQSAGKYV